MSTDLWRIPPQDADGEHVEGTRWDSALGRWIEADEFEDEDLSGANVASCGSNAPPAQKLPAKETR